MRNLRWGLTVLLSLVLLLAAVAPSFAATPVMVKAPRLTHTSYKIGVTINAKGYVTPKFTSLAKKTLVLSVYKRNKAGKYVLVKSVNGTLVNVAKYRHSTRYSGSFSLSAAGRYRVRAKFTWEDSKSAKHVKRSSFTYFKIVK